MITSITWLQLHHAEEIDCEQRNTLVYNNIIAAKFVLQCSFLNNSVGVMNNFNHCHNICCGILYAMTGTAIIITLSDRHNNDG